MMARAALPLALALALGILAAPAIAAALDDGVPGPGEKWQPGRILVRFADGTGTAECERIARAAEVVLVEHLPLVPNLWEAQTRGLVRDAMRRLGAHRDILSVQPNYLDDSVNDSGPEDAAYWPNDPYFWPAYFNNNNDKCPRSRVVGSWPLWRQGDDLTAVGAQGLQFDPLPLINRFSTLRGSYPSHHSIDVLPVWNLLGTQKSLTGPGPKGWTAEDLRRYGIAVDDTGISDHPDLKGQVAALFTVVTSLEPSDSQPEERIREVFRDNEGRNDISAVTDALETQADFTTQVQDAQRPLFMLDDPAVRNAEKWKPLDHLGQPQAPRGCDGHGTAVASVAAARANNGTGLAGVGYNVPVVGIRVGMPWDRPGVAYATNDKIDKAIEAWETWHKTATVTDADVILHAELVKVLHLPVLNMSWGAPMATYRPDTNGNVHPVLFNPVLAEALARVLSTGTTLGVAAAGNDRQAYGRGPNGRGTILQSGPERQGVALPCGLKLLATLGAWTSTNLLEPGRVNPNARADAPFHPKGVDWGRVELLCVGATSPDGRELSDTSGSGETMQDWLDSANLELGPASPSLYWQGRLIGDRAYAGGERAVFPLRSAAFTPIAPPARPVYTAGFIDAGCNEPGY
jgi:hypothetical protein